MSDEQHGEHEHHAVNYTAIFGLLCVCTGLSIVFDVSKESMSKPVLILLILGVALCKATFVLLYFMHIRFERAWKYVLLAPTAVLACALPFALAPDIAFHYYNVIVPQGETYAADHAGHASGGHGASGHSEAPHGAAAHGDTHDKGHAEHHDAKSAGKADHAAEKPHK